MRAKTRRTTPKAPRERPGEYVGFRSPIELKAKLEAAAKASNRSLSSEAQFRLERSLERESQADASLTEALTVAYGEQVAGLVLLIAQTFNDAGYNSGSASLPIQKHKDWLSDPYAFDQAAQAANQIVKLARPDGEIVTPGAHQRMIAEGLDPLVAKSFNEDRGRMIAEMNVKGMNELAPFRGDPWLTKLAGMMGPLAKWMAREFSPARTKK